MTIDEIREKARLTEGEIAETLHNTPTTQLKFESKLTDQDMLAFADEMKLELIAIANAQITKYNNTEIVPERECGECSGTGWVKAYNRDGACWGKEPCDNCIDGTEPPITVEQAIKEKLE